MASTCRIGDTLTEESIAPTFKGIKPDRDNFTGRRTRPLVRTLKMPSGNWGNAPLLMLDEVEVLFRQSQLDPDILLQYFRSLAMSGRLGIITTGVTPLNELPQTRAVSPFWNIAVTRHVSVLDSDEAAELIQRPLYGLVRYDTQSIDHLQKQSGGHPYLLQIICSNVVDLCRDGWGN